MQLCFDNEIFIIHPDQLDKNWKIFFIEKILCNEFAFKILHGSDSLDLPYIYDQLLQKNSNLIIKFNRQFADTKFYVNTLSIIKINLLENVKFMNY